MSTFSQTLYPSLDARSQSRVGRLALRGISERRLMLLLVDSLLLILAGVISVGGWAFLRPDMPLNFDLLTYFNGWITALSLMWLFLLALSGGYDLRTSANLGAIGRRLLGVWGAFGVLYLIIFFFLANQVSAFYVPQFLSGVLPLRVVPALFFINSILFELIWRAVYAKLLTQGHFRQQVLILGAGRSGQTLLKAFQEEHQTGAFNVLGIIDDDGGKIGGRVDNVPVLGSHSTMIALAKEHQVDEIVIAVSGDLNGGTFQAVMDCFEQGIQITPMPIMYEMLTGRVPVEYVGKHWYISLPLSAKPPSWIFLGLMRLLDILFGLVGLVILGALIPLVMVGNRLWSRGPLFYYQTRVGRGGKSYDIIKFRSMIPNAEKSSGAVWAKERDPRITRFGNFLRKTRIDEIPQAINVLRGDMSLIGPRPERPEFVEKLATEIPFYRSRHAVRPGLTGWAQVKYRYGASIEDSLIKLQYDLYYIKHQGLYLNLLILLKTIPVILRMQGR